MASMVTPIQLHLPAGLRKLVERRARDGGFASPSAYIEHVLRTEHLKVPNEELDSELIHGLDSGEGGIVDDDWEAQIERAAQAEMERRRAHG